MKTSMNKKTDRQDVPMFRVANGMEIPRVCANCALIIDGDHHKCNLTNKWIKHPLDEWCDKHIHRKELISMVENHFNQKKDVPVTSTVPVNTRENVLKTLEKNEQNDHTAPEWKGDPAPHGTHCSECGFRFNIRLDKEGMQIFYYCPRCVPQPGEPLYKKKQDQESIISQTVKNCTTCKHKGKYNIYPCTSCDDGELFGMYPKWEPQQIK